MGDAAHPMIPIVANGTTKAIINGWILAMELDRQPYLSAAIEAYNKQRRDAVNMMVKANREESVTRFLEIIHNLYHHVVLTMNKLSMMSF